MTAIEPHKATLDAPDVLNSAVKLAERICRTEFVPKPLRDQPDKVMAALLVGRELGLGPMTALNHIHVIEGRASIDAAIKQGKAEAAGARFKVVEMTDERCVVHAWAPGDNGQPTVITWSMKDAQRAGLTNKDNWKRYPRKMLFRRAMSEAADVVAGAAVMGLPPTTEELDGVDDNYQPAPETVAKPARTVQRRAVQHTWAKPAEPAPPLPSFDDEPPANSDGEVIDAKIVDSTPDNVLPLGEPAATIPQVKRAMAIMRGQGIDDDARHALIAIHSNGRTEHITELTKTEISALMDELERPS